MTIVVPKNDVITKEEGEEWSSLVTILKQEHEDSSGDFEVELGKMITDLLRSYIIPQSPISDFDDPLIPLAGGPFMRTDDTIRRVIAHPLLNPETFEDSEEIEDDGEDDGEGEGEGEGEDEDEGEGQDEGEGEGEEDDEGEGEGEGQDEGEGEGEGQDEGEGEEDDEGEGEEDDEDDEDEDDEDEDDEDEDDKKSGAKRMHEAHIEEIRAAVNGEIWIIDNII